MKNYLYLTRKKKCKKSPQNNLGAAEKRERRVLIQMSVLVLAFVLTCLPFWTFWAYMNFCPIINKGEEEVRKLKKWIYNIIIEYSFYVRQF